MVHSLHNHTDRSDGRCDPETLVRKAVETELEFIGIADHYATRRVPSLDDASLSAYISEVRSLQERYRDRITVLVGVEIDASRERTEIDSLDFDILNTLDYVLFEFVQDDLWKGMPFWEFLLLKDRLDVPCGLAHNDLGRNISSLRVDYLSEVLTSNRIFIELNSGRRYSKMGRFYYELSESLVIQFGEKGVRFSLGCDGHGDDVAGIEPAMSFLRDHGLEANCLTLADLRSGQRISSP